jgi:hypothetical protein
MTLCARSVEKLTRRRREGKERTTDRYRKRKDKKLRKGRGRYHAGEGQSSSA